jgi:hypothetical protein
MAQLSVPESCIASASKHCTLVDRFPATVGGKNDDRILDGLLAVGFSQRGIQNKLHIILRYANAQAIGQIIAGIG